MHLHTRRNIVVPRSTKLAWTSLVWFFWEGSCTSLPHEDVCAACVFQGHGHLDSKVKVLRSWATSSFRKDLAYGKPLIQQRVLHVNQDFVCVIGRNELQGLWRHIFSRNGVTTLVPMIFALRLQHSDVKHSECRLSPNISGWLRHASLKKRFRVNYVLILPPMLQAIMDKGFFCVAATFLHKDSRCL